jgi:hypothetical protein
MNTEDANSDHAMFHIDELTHFAVMFLFLNLNFVLLPFINIRCFSFVKQMYLDIF